MVFCLFGIQWVMPHTILELFEAWQGKFVRHCHIDVWKLVPHCLIWCIWRERNARSFEGCERSLLEIKSFFLHTLFEWSVVFSHFSWPLIFCFLICAPIVHPQCTQLSNLSIINNILMLFIQKKKKKNNHFQTLYSFPLYLLYLLQLEIYQVVSPL